MTQATSVNQLIIDVIQKQRRPSDYEKAQIIEHISRASFRNEKIRVDPSLVGQQINNTTIPNRLSALHAHWLKRVYIDLEWEYSVTPTEYLRDLQDAVINKSSIHLGYSYIIDKAGVAATYYYVGCCSENFIDPSRLGNKSKQYIYVVYSASHGALLTGYQMQELDELNDKLGGEVTWL